MSKRINSYQAVAAFVRGFFEAYARGIIDATIEGNDFSKKNDPKQIKQMMLEHYGEVNQYFFDIMFSTLVRLNYKTAEEANERMKKNFDSTVFSPAFRSFPEVFLMPFCAAAMAAIMPAAPPPITITLLISILFCRSVRPSFFLAPQGIVQHRESTCFASFTVLALSSWLSPARRLIKIG